MSEKIDELQELFMSKKGQQIQYTIGRVMLTFTFLDDALRVFKEWNSQVDYMGGQLDRYYLKPIASALLLVFIIAQVGGSTSLLLNKYANIGAWALLGVVAGQVILYTSLFDIHFFLRNAAVIGGLFVLVTSDDPYKAKRMLSGLMDTSAVNVKMDVISLVGRCLISCILLSILIKERDYMEWYALVPAMAIAVGLAIMLLIGLRAKVAAIAQAALLTIATFWSHSFFRLAPTHWERDLHQYYFFQLLTVTGAMLLIASRGAGRFSMDHNKKFG